jgi:mannose-6-phosphate isomerase-like protein (cupin superfamily)
MKHLTYISIRPWGRFYDLAEKPGKWHLKLIKIKKGRRLSLQKHKWRSEVWIIAEGRVKAQKNNRVFRLKTGDSISIWRGEIHRLEGITDAIVGELSFGRHDEQDIIRLADDYDRKM